MRIQTDKTKAIEAAGTHLRAVAVLALLVSVLSVMSCAGPGKKAPDAAGDAKTAVDAPAARTEESPAPSVVGSWELRNAMGAVTFEFQRDGAGSVNGLPLRWQMEGGTLTVTVEEQPNTYAAVLGEGALTLSGGDLAQPVTFHRAAAAGERRVAINRTTLDEPQIRALEQRFQVRIMNGEYWYDRACGAWGLEGGPTLGFIPAGLDVGGPLQADASGGGTGVFINGREIHPVDVAGLQQLTPVVPGRYWVDARGLCGYEGNPTPILDLAALAQAARSRSGGTYHSRSDITGIGSGGDGKTSYVMGKDWSVIIGE